MSLYSAIVAVHVMANIVAFGVWFAWPLLPGGSETEKQAALERRVSRAPLAGGALVLLATFLMVTKPGG